MEYGEMKMDAFIEDCAKRFCPYCGNGIIQKQRGRKKMFCSNKCRYAYHKRKKRKVPYEVKLLKEGVPIYQHM